MRKFEYRSWRRPLIKYKGVAAYLMFASDFLSDEMSKIKMRLEIRIKTANAMKEIRKTLSEFDFSINVDDFE